MDADDGCDMSLRDEETVDRYLELRKRKVDALPADTGFRPSPSSMLSRVVSEIDLFERPSRDCDVFTIYPTGASVPWWNEVNARRKERLKSAAKKGVDKGRGGKAGR